MTTSGNPPSESSSTIGDRAHNMAGKVVDKIQETASQLTGRGQGSGTPGASSGGQQSPPVMEQATDQISSRLDMGKDYVVEAVTGVAQALRQTGQHLREEGAQPGIAKYADRSAEQIERFGGYLRRRDTGQLVTDIEGFARRKPLAFAGSAFALGMLAVRFLRSEAQPQRQSPALGSGMPPVSAASLRPPGTAARPGTGTTPAAPTAMPSSSVGAAQSTATRPPGAQPPPGTQPTAPAGRPPGTGAGTGTGTPTTPPGTVPRPPQAPQTTARPASAPPSGPGSQTPGTPPTSERPGPGQRNQP